MDSRKRLILMFYWQALPVRTRRDPARCGHGMPPTPCKGMRQSTRRCPTNQERPIVRPVAAGRARGAGGARLNAERLRPDLIVPDLTLVQSAGLDLIRKRGTKTNEAQLILITSREDSNAEGGVRAVGTDCVIAQRAAATDLVPAIERMSDRHTLHSPARSPNVLGRSCAHALTSGRNKK